MITRSRITPTVSMMSPAAPSLLMEMRRLSLSASTTTIARLVMAMYHRFLPKASRLMAQVKAQDVV